MFSEVSSLFSNLICDVLGLASYLGKYRAPTFYQFLAQRLNEGKERERRAISFRISLL